MAASPQREGEKESGGVFVGRRWDLIYKGRARNVTNQKKKKKKNTQSFTATVGRERKKNATPQPRHDIAFWSRLDRGKMHIHEVSNV